MTANAASTDEEHAATLNSFMLFFGSNLRSDWQAAKTRPARKRKKALGRKLGKISPHTAAPGCDPAAASASVIFSAFSEPASQRFRWRSSPHWQQMKPAPAWQAVRRSIRPEVQRINQIPGQCTARPARALDPRAQFDARDCRQYEAADAVSAHQQHGFRNMDEISVTLGERRARWNRQQLVEEVGDPSGSGASTTRRFNPTGIAVSACA